VEKVEELVEVVLEVVVRWWSGVGGDDGGRAGVG
jgi:hypothetical protein